LGDDWTHNVAHVFLLIPNNNNFPRQLRVFHRPFLRWEVLNRLEHGTKASRQRLGGFLTYAIATSHLRKQLHQISNEAPNGQVIVDTTTSLLSKPFSECVTDVVSALEQSVDGFPDNLHQLSNFDFSVVLKNRDRVIVYSNESHRNTFSPDQRTIGLTSDSFLDSSNVGVSKHSDLLLLNGAEQLSFQHMGRGADGLCYLIETHKRNLLNWKIRGLAILVVARTGAIVESKDLKARLNWSDQVEIFNKLDSRDREICRQVSMGVTTREIAAQLKITPRSVESHKQKILEALVLPNTIEMIKLLVRFQEHGIADLGI
jgi:DNA-binding CsgD family transcriptional regulator